MEAKARKLKTKMQKDMLVADSDEEDFFKAKSKQEAGDSSSAEDE